MENKESREKSKDIDTRVLIGKVKAWAFKQGLQANEFKGFPFWTWREFLIIIRSSYSVVGKDSLCTSLKFETGGNYYKIQMKAPSVSRA